jgi:hypothetical protein
MLLLFLCPGTIRVASCPASSQLISSVPALFGSGVAAWSPPPLHALYNEPYAVLRWGPHAFTLHVGQWEEIIAVSCLKTCSAVDTIPGSPRLCGRPPGPGAAAMPAAAHPGGPAATKRVSISDLLVSSPLQQPRIRPGTDFLQPHGEVLHNLGRQLLHGLHKGYEDRPLTSSAPLPRPVLRGKPCGGCLRP